MLVPHPYPLPPVPEPTSLAEPVDWMAWSHPDLHRMIHSGPGTATAERVAEQWGVLAYELQDIAERLGRAVGASESGWQGESAARAREGMRVLLSWAGETVLLAERVRHAIHAEADHLEWARAAMPDPVPVWHAGDCGVVPTPHQRRIATPVLAVPPRAEADAAHREAAEVMARYQHGSSEVDATIPAFAKPANPVVRSRPGTVPTPGWTTPATAGDHDHPRPITPAPSTPAPSTTPAPTEPAPDRQETAVREVTPREAVPDDPADRDPEPQPKPAATDGSGRGGAMGGMGGGMGAAQKDDDTEHRTPAYLREDDDVFGTNMVVAPPVLGG